MNVDSTLLSQVLTWLVSSGGAGVAAYFLMEKVRLLAALAPEPKRYVSLALAAVIAMAAFSASVGLGYAPVPSGAQAWGEALFAVAFVATNLGQIIHGRAKLRQPD